MPSSDDMRDIIEGVIKAPEGQKLVKGPGGKMGFWRKVRGHSVFMVPGDSFTDTMNAYEAQFGRLPGPLRQVHAKTLTGKAKPSILDEIRKKRLRAGNMRVRGVSQPPPAYKGSWKNWTREKWDKDFEDFKAGSNGTSSHELLDFTTRQGFKGAMYARADLFNFLTGRTDGQLVHSRIRYMIGTEKTKQAFQYVRNGLIGSGRAAVNPKNKDDIAFIRTLYREATGDKLNGHSVYLLMQMTGDLDHGRRPEKTITEAAVHGEKKGSCSCWKGYDRVPGTKPCAPGSCKKCDHMRKTGRLKDGMSESSLAEGVIRAPKGEKLVKGPGGAMGFWRNIRGHSVFLPVGKQFSEVMDDYEGKYGKLPGPVRMAQAKAATGRYHSVSALVRRGVQSANARQVGSKRGLPRPSPVPKRGLDELFRRQRAQIAEKRAGMIQGPPGKPKRGIDEVFGPRGKGRGLDEVSGTRGPNSSMIQGPPGKPKRGIDELYRRQMPDNSSDPKWRKRVEELENEGMTTSDAQSAADVEWSKKGPRRTSEAPAYDRRAAAARKEMESDAYKSFSGKLSTFESKWEKGEWDADFPALVTAAKASGPHALHQVADQMMGVSYPAGAAGRERSRRDALGEDFRRFLDDPAMVKAAKAVAKGASPLEWDDEATSKRIRSAYTAAGGRYSGDDDALFTAMDSVPEFWKARMDHIRGGRMEEGSYRGGVMGDNAKGSQKMMDDYRHAGMSHSGKKGKDGFGEPNAMREKLKAHMHDKMKKMSLTKGQHGALANAKGTGSDVGHTLMGKKPMREADTGDWLTDV